MKWERDKVEMYAFHLTVPQGCTTLADQNRFPRDRRPHPDSRPEPPRARISQCSAGTRCSSIPQDASAANVQVTPSVTFPTAWQFGTALHIDGGYDSHGAISTASFDPVSLEILIDSPVLAGKYFSEVPLAPEITPKHYLDMAADGPEELDLSREQSKSSAAWSVRPARSTRAVTTASITSWSRSAIQSRTSASSIISPATIAFPPKTFIDRRPSSSSPATLLPHEFTHSWNGKYRRPAGLATSNYQKPMEGDLLWVYEGLTEYFGDVLQCAPASGPRSSSRAGFDGAAELDNWPGRTWRDLQDTATMAQVLYDTGGGWENWRRNVDYYPEGELLWLDVDTTIRKLSGGKKSLNDFAAAFEGLGGNTPPKVVPYTFDDVVAGLNAVQPNDWAAFLRQRLDSNAPGAPLGGIENGGYKLTYSRAQPLERDGEYAERLLGLLVLAWPARRQRRNADRRAQRRSRRQSWPRARHADRRSQRPQLYAGTATCRGQRCRGSQRPAGGAHRRKCRLLQGSQGGLPRW